MGSACRKRPWRLCRTRDSGTLQDEIFFNEDESEAVVFERYRDADAAYSSTFPTSSIRSADHGLRLRHGRSAGTPNAKMNEQLGKGSPKLFTP